MFVFPAHLFNPKTVQARIRQASVSGGIALNGVEDTILTDGGGRWEVVYSDIDLNTPAKIRAFEAWNEYLAGGSEPCLVPLLSLTTAPRPYLGKRPMRVSGFYSNAEVFPTVAEYAERMIIAETAGSASLRATSLAISISRGGEIKGGEKFSIGERAHRIGAHVSGNIWKIAPPLREAVDAGAAINFDWPVVKCVSAPGEDFSPAIQRQRFAGGASISFQEVI